MPLSGELVPAQPGSFLGLVGPPSCRSIRPVGTLQLSETCFGETSRFWGWGVGPGFQGASTPWRPSRLFLGRASVPFPPSRVPIAPGRPSFGLGSQEEATAHPWPGRDSLCRPRLQNKGPCWAT